MHSQSLLAMEEQREMQIPVFTVWKNNVILKNIFLINSSPVNQVETKQQNDEICKTHQQFEETLLVGRHPDCDIRLEHPSISRFHLRIHSKPSFKHLFLTDLSSVHGTWLSGKRIDPDSRTKMNESDTLRLGGSSRVYRLQWIPLSQAYDVSNPYVPPLDFVEPQEDEEEQIIKDDNLPRQENEEVKAVDSVTKGLECDVLCNDDAFVIDKVAPETEEQVLTMENVSIECDVLCNDDALVIDKVAPETEEQVLTMENVSIELDDSDMEGLMSLFLDDTPDLSAGDEMPPDPTTQKVFSEVVVNNQYVQTLDSVLDGLVPLFLGENWEWVGQEENYMPCPTEKEYPPESLKHEVLEFLEKIICHVPSDLSVTENLDTTTAGERGSEFVSGMTTEGDNEITLQKQDIPRVAPSSPSMPENMAFDVTVNLDDNIAGGKRNEFVNETIQNENKSLLQDEKDIQDGMWSFWCGSLVAPTSSLVTREDLLCTENSELDVEIPQNECMGSVDVYKNSSVKDYNMSKLWSFWSGNMGVESSVCSSLSDAGFLSEFENKLVGYDCQSPPLSSIKSSFGILLITSDQKSESSIWSRRGKLQNTPQILTSRSEGKKMRSDQKKIRNEPLSRALFDVEDEKEENELFTPNKENCTPNTHRSMRKLAILDEVKNSSDQKIRNEPLSRALFDVEGEKEENELFTPNKENCTPNTHRSMRKLAILDEVKNSSSVKSPLLKMTGSPRINHEDNLSPSSDKENYSRRTSLKQKTSQHTSGNKVKRVRSRERKGERMPFQSLLGDSPMKCTSEICAPDAAMNDGSSVTCAKVASKTHLPDKSSGERICKWSMLIDTTTLLNKESRKALQLLEGLKGTQLIIPRIVIRDLACLRRQTSFFRRNTEVSSALEWIEDCMVRTQWWIHVQNLMEEEWPVAPTPPASPYSQGAASCSFTISTLESQPLLLSPTVEDHVIDYAISFKRNKKTDGQLVLLSNDLTLKIKAMAEGIICETAEEFRESLVNPFSERFMWADSSPRGQTWSCSDDIVLREKFYPSSLKMTPKAMENVKGLKLVLLHNSQYYERMTAIH